MTTTPALTADAWNSLYPVGTPVIAYPGVRPEFGLTKYPRLETRTRSRAWNLGHGEPVVKVDGYAGGISLEHVDVQEQAATAVEAPLAEPGCDCRQNGQDGDGRVRYQGRDREFVNLPCRNHKDAR